MNSNPPKTPPIRALRELADRVIEAPDFPVLATLLTQALPQVLQVDHATLLHWDRKFESFYAVSPGETRQTLFRSEDPVPVTPDARYMVSEGRLIETAGHGDGVLLPLMARSGLVGMLVLGPRRGRRKTAYTEQELRTLSLIASRAALALENHVYLHEVVSSERMAVLGTMAGMLAHDFRGPMTVIRGYAELLAANALSPDEIQSRAAIIIEMVDRLERMTIETLDFARGGGRLSRRPVMLPSALEEIMRDIGRELPGLEITTDLAMAPLRALLDLDKLRRVLGNMAANARDAQAGHGRLHLAARIEGDRLTLRLTDEGPGVPPPIRDRLFEPFITGGKKGGTGLGLAVARRFIEDHGGTIELVHGGPGADFRITLPLETVEKLGG